MPRLNLSNNFETTLANGITETDTSFDLTDATGAPATPFRGTIYEDDPKDGEIVEVGNISGNTLSNVQRGLEGTPAQAWVAGMKFAVLGTAGTYGELVSTDDSRLSDAREPTAHKNTHATGGSDALSPSDIGASPDTHGHNAVDVSYDNTDSGLSATNVKGAIDEVVSGSATIITQSIEGVHWISKNPAPISKYFVGTCSYNGVGYLAKNSLFSYDADLDEWTNLTSNPESSGYQMPAITGYNGKIYFISGDDTNTFYSFDLSTKVWTTLAPIPYPYDKACNLFIEFWTDETNSYIFAGAGSEGTSGGVTTSNKLYRYNIDTDTWEQRTSLPFSGVATSVVYDGYIYVHGDDGFAKYNPSTDTWTSLTPQGVTGSYPSIVLLGNYIYLQNGTKFCKYDTVADTWQTLDSLSENQYHAGAFVASNTIDANEPEKIYVVCGRTQQWYYGSSDYVNYVKEYNFNIEVSAITAPLTGIVRWNDDTIEGVTKNLSYSPSATGAAIFIGTTA